MSRKVAKAPRVLEEVRGKECRLCSGADTIVQRWTGGLVVVSCPLCGWESRLAYAISANGTIGYLEAEAPLEG